MVEVMCGYRLMSPVIGGEICESDICCGEVLLGQNRASI